MQHVRQNCGMLESQLHQFFVNQVLCGIFMNSFTRESVRRSSSKDQFQRIVQNFEVRTIQTVSETLQEQKSEVNDSWTRKIKVWSFVGTHGHNRRSNTPRDIHPTRHTPPLVICLSPVWLVHFTCPLATDHDLDSCAGHKTRLKRAHHLSYHVNIVVECGYAHGSGDELATMHAA